MGILLTIAFFMILIMGARSQKQLDRHKQSEERIKKLEERLDQLEQQQSKDSQA
ncbi:hypothetical protein LCL89_03715 [Halobacillus yeomjeoni]|uniref:Uncharacterized protein n=1 Tax=Halobacillus yeomjeoni TaxID=311194 RepID=A0A931MUM3_9BACI|nr:hypothetical protein [Halobacillus yeomjeoni]MBH0229439.1 hypothetical protein [Halobacillus yeomjeoni]MCA0983153.1 hypothetical protein [Halobacillus yeomjeoni]